MLAITTEECSLSCVFVSIAALVVSLLCIHSTNTSPHRSLDLSSCGDNMLLDQALHNSIVIIITFPLFLEDWDLFSLALAVLPLWSLFNNVPLDDDKSFHWKWCTVLVNSIVVLL